MNLLNSKYLAFTLIVVLMAIMDGLNFVLPHNQGFFSLTYSGFDAWHLCKILILTIIAIHFIWDKDSKWQINMLKLGALGVIAYLGQLFVFNFLFKL